MSAPSTVVVTGSSGLIGRHAAIRLHAANREAQAAGAPPPWRIVLPARADMACAGRLARLMDGAGAVLHVAGACRGEGVEAANVALAETLARAVALRPAPPRIVYANSARAGEDTPYGRGKARAAEILGGAAPLTDVALPHVFGEGARPGHNTVTATLIERIHSGVTPRIEPGAEVRLLHAGAAARILIGAAREGPARIAPEGRRMSVAELWDRLRAMHDSYGAGILPDLADAFDRDLFNAYRAAAPSAPRRPPVHRDPRGALFEAVKGGGGTGGQSFVSTTRPGVTRGDHFHLGKVERFVVLSGTATIRLRPVMGGRVTEHLVTGAAPAAIDIPTLHAHSIENVGEEDLLTLFWSSEIFDPSAPDTYAEPVL